VTPPSRKGVRPSGKGARQQYSPHQPDRSRQRTVRGGSPASERTVDGRKPEPARGPALGYRQERRPTPGPSKANYARSREDIQIVFGKHSVRAAFQARPDAILRVVMREGASRYLQEFVDLATEIGVEPEMLRSGEFLRAGDLSEDDKHQGIFVVTSPLPVCTEYDFDLLDDAKVVVILDQISNPQNFGTIIRTCAFFGADAVIWLKNRAVDIDATVLRIAVGGTEFVKLFRVTNMARSLELLKERGFWVYGFDERGEKTLAEAEFADKAVLVIGAEGGGLRERTKEFCDEMVRIPGGRSGLESLNAAVAAGIVLAEVFR
jgi:23S rRNA (guanosine2251-2'-O)-methyltransferase